jgi:Flp pilus assembly pilin Flp
MLGMIRGLIARLLKDTDGATAIEYGLIVSLIAIFLMGSFSLLADNLNGIFDFFSTFFS